MKPFFNFVKILSLFILSAGVLISCQTVPVQRFQHAELLSPPAEKPKPKEKKLLVQEAPAVPDIPIVRRSEVDVWIRYFTGRGREQARLYLERSQRYLDVMRLALRKEGLPQNLVYMVMIESGFSPQARSRANAVGYWQFIESTGRRYGLKINSFVDERKDPFLSTSAAGRYLKDLHNLFGSWYLAMASYNAGEYRVNRAMMKHYTRDFWRLTHKKSIPRETREYVPKFMAAQWIAENPEKYGFVNLKYHKPIRFESAAVHQPLSLKKLAGHLSIPYKDLKMLNPKYLGEYVPLSKTGSTILRVPNGFSEKMTAQIITASAMNRPKPKTYVYYKVRWGDSLYSLARRNRTTVNTIARMNRMSSKSQLRAGRVIKLPPRYYGYAKKSLVKKKPKTLHKVRRGESLGRVSKKYGVSLAQLKKWNRLSSEVIHPGQVLILKNPDKKTTRTHVVQRGETLISIAKKYKVQLTALMRNNSLTFKSILKTGQTIIIPE